MFEKYAVHTWSNAFATGYHLTVLCGALLGAFPIHAAGLVSENQSTLAVCPPLIWADATNTAAISVYLMDTNGNPVAGEPVSLSASGPALPLISPLAATSGVDGVVVFVAVSTNAGNATFTATAGTNNVILAQTVSVSFVTPPPDLSVYIPDSRVLKTWDTSTGWAEWTKERTTSLDACGHIVLGKPEDPGSREGWMYINAPAGLSYFNSGIEVTFNLAPKGIDNFHSTHTLIQMLTWDDAFGLGKPRQGFDIWTGGDVSQGNTRQMFADGVYTTDSWDVAPASLPGLHTMAMLRYASGVLETYVDGVLVNTQQTTDPAVSQLQRLGVGFEVSGNWYITRGTIVERVRAFTYDPVLGAVDPDVSTVTASVASVWADGLARSIITVTLKDADGHLIPGKDVSLTKTSGPDGLAIETLIGTSGPNGKSTFSVTSTNEGPYVFAATETSDDPDVVLSQMPTVTFVEIDRVSINVNIDTALRAGLVGPAGSLGLTWNERLQNSGISASDLLATNGTVTSVGFTSTSPSVGAWNGPALQMLTGSAFTSPSDLIITRLPKGRKFDLYIASYYYNEQGSKATFTTSNAATNGAIQYCDNGGAAGQSAIWVRGQNYVVFQAVEPDVNSEIRVTMTKTAAIHAMLSGFQLVEYVAPPKPYPTGALFTVR